MKLDEFYAGFVNFTNLYVRIFVRNSGWDVLATKDVYRIIHCLQGFPEEETDLLTDTIQLHLLALTVLSN
jgi:hypothetical protein